MSLANRIKAEFKGDSVIWAIVFILSLFSILIVYSSTGSLAFKERGGNTEYYLIKQIVILAIGLLITYLCHLLHYVKYKKAATVLLVISVVLLIFTLGFGVNINHAKRWLTVPFLRLTFQTSDLAKIGLIIYVAKAISDKQDIIKDLQSAFIPIIVPIVVVCSLIAPADLSTAVVLFTTGMGMMFVGRVTVKYIMLLIFCGIIAFAFLIILAQAAPELGIRVDTWSSRMTNFLYGTGENFQVEQAKIAVAKGGWLGMGPGNSTQRNFLSAAYTDYVYSTIIEEYGLIGGIAVMGLYILLFFRVIRLVTIGQKSFGSMLAMGMAMILVVQAFANMSVALAFIPVAGLPMPMVSLGGTSLLFSCVALGIILSVSKYIEETKS